jgi:hypothetical protein
MKDNDLYGTSFLYAEDLDGKTPTVAIEAYHPPETVDAADGSKVRLGVLEFKGAKKKLALCKTNYRIIRCMHGVDESQWIGKPITLCTRILPSAFGQKLVPCVRVKIPEDKEILSKISYSLRQPKTYGVDPSTV